MITLNYAWRLRRIPHPQRSAFKRLAVRAAKLAKLPDTGDWELNICFVGDRAMTKANAEFVGHAGSTDVITFSYFDDLESVFPGEAAVELIICADAAVREGEKRVNSSYSREMVLYLVHGLLHSAGEDDLTPEARRKMRRKEREVMSKLEREFDFAQIFPEVSQD